MATTSNLYKILEALYGTDSAIWSKLSGSIQEINGTSPIAVTGDTTKSISLNVATSDPLLTVGTNGLQSTISLEAVSPSDSAYASQYKLVGANGQIGPTIDIPKDQFLSDAKFGYSTKNNATGTDWSETKTSTRKYPVLQLTFEISGSKNPVYIPVGNLVDTYTAGNGLSVSNNEFSIDTTITATKTDISNLTSSESTDWSGLSSLLTNIETLKSSIK